ncbi:MAG: class I SAM-dependent rRNA methyltransferase [Pelovirga sp.]
MKQCLVGPETRRVLLQGHPWVIADRYTRQWPKIAPGELIALVDEQRRFLATALADPGSRVVARVLAPTPLTGITPAWLADRLHSAAALREHALLGETDSYRLVNAEGDGLPGMTVDRYGDYLMLQFYTDAWEAHRDLLTAALQRVFAPRGIYLKFRPQQTRRLEAQNKGNPTNPLLCGEAAPLPLKVKENGLIYQVNLRSGLHTGLFPDQRRNRREIMQRCQGRTVLNLFAFTGAFSVAAAAAGADRVTSIDVSEKYLKIARENFVGNGIDPHAHEFLVADVFAELARLQAEGRQFDCILFDPPSFSTTKKSRFATQGGTAQLVSATLPLLRPGGLLCSSTNHQKVILEDYLKELRRGALQAEATLKTLLIHGQPEDFPCDVGFPEGRYLKFVISVKP